MAKKILIAEDDQPMARALELKLQKEGFDILVVADGEEAVKLIEAEKPDLVLLDLMMPKKDGFGVLADLKAKGIVVPIFITSNLSQEEDRQKAKELGAQDFLVKSDTSIIEIVRKVKEAIEK